MKFSTKLEGVTKFKAEGLVIGVTENKINNGNVAALDKILSGHIKKTARTEKFKGKAGQVLSLNTLGMTKVERIVLVGLGIEKDITLDTARRSGAKGASAMRASGIKAFGITMAAHPLNSLSSGLLAQALAEAIILASYSFDTFKTKKSDGKIDLVTFLLEKESDGVAVRRGVEKGKKLAEAVCFARDLINLPSNYATPSYLASQAQKLAKGKLKCKVLGPRSIRKLGMGGLMGVSQGSNEPAKFIILEFMNSKTDKKPIVLVGKGVTFDTGGISIKPSANMEEMKMDMSGAAAVLGAMKAASELNLRANIVALVPTTENMPGGNSYNPGDV